MDKGPWRPYFLSDGRKGVASDDFVHDVVLILTGAFEDEEQRAKYCEWLAATLNAAQPTGDQ